MSANSEKKLSPKKIGVFITSDDTPYSGKKTKVKARELDKFGFASEQEVIDYIKENAKQDELFLIYTYETQGGLRVMKGVRVGTRQELDVV